MARMAINIPTEPIGSVPRPASLREAAAALSPGAITQAEYDTAVDAAVKETIGQFEATGSPIVTDGEQARSSFATCTMEGLDNIAPDGVVIPFEDGHTPQLPRLTTGPFRYGLYAGSHLPGPGALRPGHSNNR
jgi:5-methyltetrahydropteroyltriglutamate--homocysteine methyltransferase